MSKASEKKHRSEKPSSKGGGTRPKKLSDTIVAVFPDGKAGKMALKALRVAADTSSSSEIELIPFQQLDFGNLEALDKFYSAPVVVVDVTERQYEACLFYQIGLRESFGMKHNVVLCEEKENIPGRKGSLACEQISSIATNVVSP